MRLPTSLFVLACCTWLCTGQLDRDEILRNTLKARRLPRLDVCGRSTQPYGTRIINGRPAVLGSYPWMAAIGYLRPDNSETWLCGGSLITDQYVITAAHCLAEQSIRPYRIRKVRLGDLDLDDSQIDGASPIDVGIESWKIHEQYQGVKKINDIGLIKLDRKITFTDLMRPICLPLPDLAINEYVDYTPVIAGWGRSVNETNVKSDTRLLEGEVTIRDRDGCRRNNTAVLRNVLIDQRVLCASAPLVDSCQGDSGGPMMWQARPPNARPGTPSNTYLMGIVSYGYRCAVPNYPGVYTRVAMYMQWIIENLEI